jgi:hypothetical protein
VSASPINVTRVLHGVATECTAACASHSHQSKDAALWKDADGDGLGFEFFFIFFHCWPGSAMGDSACSSLAAHCGDSGASCTDDWPRDGQSTRVNGSKRPCSPSKVDPLNGAVLTSTSTVNLDTCSCSQRYTCTPTLAHKLLWPHHHAAPAGSVLVLSHHAALGWPRALIMRAERQAELAMIWLCAMHGQISEWPARESQYKQVETTEVQTKGSDTACKLPAPRAQPQSLAERLQLYKQVETTEVQTKGSDTACKLPAPRAQPQSLAERLQRHANRRGQQSAQ